MKKMIPYKLGSEVSEYPQIQSALKICNQLRSERWSAYWVGGAVRDLWLRANQQPPLLSIEATTNPEKIVPLHPPLEKNNKNTATLDIDIATDAPFNEITHIFPHTRAIGRAFGVGLVVEAGHTFEVATFRKESDYADRRHPSQVSAGTLEEDSARRDFTINALYYDPIDEVIIDFYDGLDDLRNKRLRCVGDPALRLHEDPLRILRLFRFAANLQFSIDPQTEQAAVALSAELNHISKERILLEIAKIKPYAIDQFSEFLKPLQSTLFGLKNDSFQQNATPAESAMTHLPLSARAFPGTVLALMCARNEGFQRFKWVQIFQSWPLSLEEKAQLELFQRRCDGLFKMPSNKQDSESWNIVLDTFRWLQRQSRISVEAAIWLSLWNEPVNLRRHAEDSLDELILKFLQNALEQQIVTPDISLQSFIDLTVQKKSQPLRKTAEARLARCPAKSAVGRAFLMIDLGIFLLEINANKERIPDFFHPHDHQSFELLCSEAERWATQPREPKKNTHQPKC